VLIATKYALFAVVAGGCNLGVQALTSSLYGGSFAVYASLCAGTLVGFVVKFVLDKHFIFHDTTRGGARNTRQLMRYGLTGVITTAVFCSLELGADYIFHARLARYLGGALGLVIGYWLKYHLDTRLVFNQSLLSSQASRGRGEPRS
jgi:hypothetical protein